MCIRDSSIGIVTARAGIFVPDNQVIHLGNVAGTGDLQIYHDTSHSYVKDVGTGDLVLQTQGGHVRIKYGSDTMALFQPSNKAELYFANSPKLATTSIGVQIDTTLLLNGAAGNPGRLRLQEGGALSEIRVGRNTDSSSELYFDTEIGGTTATRWKIDTSASLVPTSTYNIGSATAEIGDVYFANSKGLKLGSNQAGDLYNDGTDTYFRNSASNGQMLIRSNGNLSLIHISEPTRPY